MYKGRIVIDHVAPDYHAKYPKACMSGWGRLTFNVTPTGKVLPCHAAETIPNLEFWNAREKSLGECWADSPGFNAFRGTDWMKEPCRSCERKNGGFRRLPLSGAGAGGRRGGHRSDLLEIAVASSDRRNRRARVVGQG